MHRSFAGVKTKIKICKWLLILGLILGVALLCEYHGYKRGFADGGRSTNAWWIDKKSSYYDTSDVIRKRLNRKHNQI